LGVVCGLPPHAPRDFTVRPSVTSFPAHSRPASSAPTPHSPAGAVLAAGFLPIRRCCCSRQSVHTQPWTYAALVPCSTGEPRLRPGSPPAPLSVSVRLTAGRASTATLPSRVCAVAVPRPHARQGSEMWPGRWREHRAGPGGLKRWEEQRSRRAL
jgi:hypothetical protein